MATRKQDESTTGKLDTAEETCGRGILSLLIIITSIIYYLHSRIFRSFDFLPSIIPTFSMHLTVIKENGSFLLS